MKDGNFQFFIPLQKDTENSLIGIASTMALDRDEEKMSDNALADMEREILAHGVNLFGNHEHGWENTLGVIKHAKRENGKLGIKIDLDNEQTNPKVRMLLEKIKRGIKLGLSVGGSVIKDREEYDKEAGRRVKVIDGVRLLEISVVGIPSNADSFMTLPQAIAKSLHGNKINCPVCSNRIFEKEKCRMCLWEQ